MTRRDERVYILPDTQNGDFGPSPSGIPLHLHPIPYSHTRVATYTG